MQDGAATLATYTYNGRGQRVKKTANGGTTYFVYGEDGKLLFESNTAGTLNAYLWLGDLLVGVATPEGTFAIETDHLGTPRLASNLYGATAWRWPLLDNAFGDREARTIQDGDGPGLEFNLRFPGQYHDQETGLHYNYYRDYEPTIGRYIESDPIGLDGGMNTYGYALANPFSFIDPFGLDAFSCLDMAMNGEQSFMDCYIDNEIIRPMEDKFDAFAEAADCGLKCTAVCGAKFAAGAAAAEAAKRGAEELTKKFAKGTVKKFLKRGIPVAGWIETGISGGLAITCTVNCWRK